MVSLGSLPKPARVRYRAKNQLPSKEEEQIVTAHASFQRREKRTPTLII